MSTSERVQLWAMRGLTAAEITHQTKLPRSTVKYHLKRFKETGSWSRREYPVRVKTLTPFAECIRKHLKLHPHASATELHELLATKFQLMVSVRTVQRYLKSAGRAIKGAGGPDNSGEESDTSTTEELSVGSGGEHAPVSKMRCTESVTVTSYSTPSTSEDETKSLNPRRRIADVLAAADTPSSSPSQSPALLPSPSTSSGSFNSSSKSSNSLSSLHNHHHHQHHTSSLAQSSSHHLSLSSSSSSSSSSSHLSQAAFCTSSSSSLSSSCSTINSSPVHAHLSRAGLAIGHSSNQVPSSVGSATTNHHPAHLLPMPYGILPHYPLLMPPASLHWQDFSPSSSSALHSPLSHPMNTAPPSSAAPSVSGLPLMGPLGLFPIYPPFNTHNTPDFRSQALSALPQTNNPSKTLGAAATATPISSKVEPSLEALINAALVSD